MTGMPCHRPFQSNGLIAVGSLYSVYDGIHIIAASAVTGNSLTLNGYVDDTTADPSGWFVVGSEPDMFAWTTSTQSVSDAGNISVDVAGAPLVAGETFMSGLHVPMVTVMFLTIELVCQLLRFQHTQCILDLG